MVMAMMTSDTDDPVRPRGRPTVLDRGAVAETTCRLWAERGYHAVGWREIADATGVSVRTLVRHFSRKSEIAWVGVPAATKRLRHALRDMPDDTPLHDALRSGIVASISGDPMLSPSAASWVRLVYAPEELAGSAGAAYRPWIEELAGFVSKRIPTINPATAMAIASGYQAATFSTLVAWSENACSGSAAENVEDTLRWLYVGLSEPKP
jgi:AcrR family transcriptional regulator